MDAESIRSKVMQSLRSTGPNAFEATFDGARLIFPANSWENARLAGVAFRDALSRMNLHTWLVIAELVRTLGLSQVHFTSLYRATGTGPHTKGRGIDFGYLQRVGDPALTLLRRDDTGAPTTEPELARAARVALAAMPWTTQVLTPWWMHTGYTPDGPNLAADDLSIEHRTHMHVTTVDGAPSAKPMAPRRRSYFLPVVVSCAAAIAIGAYVVRRRRA